MMASNAGIFKKQCDKLIEANITKERRTIRSVVRFAVQEAMAFNHENDDFYQGTRWKIMRQRILRRDKYMCQNCRRYGRQREDTEVHHIDHLEDHPERAYDPKNLVSLCHSCHNAQHPEKAKVMNKCRKMWISG